MNTSTLGARQKKPFERLSFEWRELPSLPPNKNKWSSAVPVGDKEWHQIGLGGAVSGVHGDWLLVGGGANFPEPGLTVTRPNTLGKVFWDELFALNLKTKAWSTRPMKLPKALGYAATISLPGGVLVMGGEGFEGANGSSCQTVQLFTEVFLITFSEHSQEVSFTNYPSLPKAVRSPSASLLDRNVFLQGGHDFFCLSLDNLAAGWSQLNVWPGEPRSAALTASVDGNVLLASGKSLNPNGDVIHRDVYAYDPSKVKWTKVPDMPLGAMAGMAFTVEDRFFVVIGGDCEEQRAREYRRLENERSQAHPGGSNWSKANTTITFLHDHHTGFNQQIQIFDCLTATWVDGGFLPSAATVTSQPVQWHGELLLVSGEVSPGKRTPKIWAGKPRYFTE